MFGTGVGSSNIVTLQNASRRRPCSLKRGGDLTYLFKLIEITMMAKVLRTCFMNDPFKNAGFILLDGLPSFQ